MFEVATPTFKIMYIVLLSLRQITSHLNPFPKAFHSCPFPWLGMGCMPQTLQWFPFAFGVGSKVFTQPQGPAWWGLCLILLTYQSVPQSTSTQTFLQFPETSQVEAKEGGREQPWIKYGHGRQTRLEPTSSSKMAEDSTSSRPWSSLYTHCEYISKLNDTPSNAMTVLEANHKRSKSGQVPSVFPQVMLGLFYHSSPALTPLILPVSLKVPSS